MLRHVKNHLGSQKPSLTSAWRQISTSLDSTMPNKIPSCNCFATIRTIQMRVGRFIYQHFFTFLLNHSYLFPPFFYLIFFSSVVNFTRFKFWFIWLTLLLLWPTYIFYEYLSLTLIPQSI